MHGFKPGLKVYFKFVIFEKSKKKSNNPLVLFVK